MFCSCDCSNIVNEGGPDRSRSRGSVFHEIIIKRGGDERECALKELIGQCMQTHINIIIIATTHTVK